MPRSSYSQDSKPWNTRKCKYQNDFMVLKNQKLENFKIFKKNNKILTSMKIKEPAQARHFYHAPKALRPLLGITEIRRTSWNRLEVLKHMPMLTKNWKNFWKVSSTWAGPVFHIWPSCESASHHFDPLEKSKALSRLEVFAMLRKLWDHLWTSLKYA